MIWNFSDETATVRVTNLSEDVRDSDLQDLFRPFGTIARIYLAKDKSTGQSKVVINFILWKLFTSVCKIFITLITFLVNSFK